MCGVDIAFSKGKLTLNGTTTGDGTIIGSFTNQVNAVTLKAGTYTISSRILSGTFTKTTNDVAIDFRKSSDNTIIFSVAGELNFTKTTQITLSEDTTIYFSAYTNGAGTIFNNLVLGLQIEEGNTATPYEDYIAPSIIADDTEFYSKGYELYNNPTGTTGNVTLSDSANNYSYIEIFFRERAIYPNSIKVRREDIANISLTVSFTDGTYLYTVTQVASINGNTITFDGTGAKRSAIYSTGSLFQNSIITIYKVVGYK